jgi:pimeloyl-ACP methyl ester carboxylesterase
VNKLLSILIDQYALSQLHKVRSKESQFKKNLRAPIPINKINSFYPGPSLVDIRFEPEQETNGYQSGKYYYPSPIPTNFPENDQVTGLYCRNKEANPVYIIFVHGWRMSNIKRIESLSTEYFSQQGYNIFYFTLPYHSQRTPKSSLYSGEAMISADIERTLMAIKQAVTDLRTLIRWIKNQKGEVVLIGISLGGLIVNLTTILEKEIDALISIFYANSLAEETWKAIPLKYIKKDMELNGFTYDRLKDYWAIIEPSNFKPAIDKERILLMTALYDQYILKDDADFLWNAWGSPKRQLYKCGHAGIILKRNDILSNTISFIKTIL